MTYEFYDDESKVGRPMERKQPHFVTPKLAICKTITAIVEELHLLYFKYPKHYRGQWL